MDVFQSLYALTLVWGTASLQPTLAGPLIRPLPRQWFRVPDGERVLHRVLGVGLFWWLLDVIGWNRLIIGMRAFSGTKAGLVSLEQHARDGAIAHGICFAIHVVHFYPVLLQRSILLRLQPLLDNAAARPPIAD